MKFDEINVLDTLSIIRKIISEELRSLEYLYESIGSEYINVIREIHSCSGKVVMIGMGKSGHIARKIAATFASTGTPSFFVHPAEACHGDLGMISASDMVIMISNSGESRELELVSEHCNNLKIPVVLITSNIDTRLSSSVKHHLLLPKTSEACPLGIAPTTSTLLTLSIGDALAGAVLVNKGFAKDDFSKLHPAGKLGLNLRKLSYYVHRDRALPLIPINSNLSDAILEMTKGMIGCVGIVDKDGVLLGIFTDGDLRRNIKLKILDEKISNIMSANPFVLSQDQTIEDAILLFRDKRIPCAFICEFGVPIGVIHIHDIIGKAFNE